MSVETAESAQLRIIHANENEAKVTFNRNAISWLICEVCEYEPMPPRMFNFAMPGAMDSNHPDGYPFMTTGEREIIDLSHGRLMECDFYEVEGSIQGLVYAVDAINHGGKLSRESYEEYIVDRLIPADFDVKSRLMLPRELQQAGYEAGDSQ